MAIAADISSYQLPPTKTALEQASDFGHLKLQGQAIERGDIGLDKQKLDLINQQWGLVNHELSTLANDPGVSKDKVVSTFTNFAKTFKIPPQMAQEFLSQIPDDPKQIKDYIEKTLQRGMSVNEAVNFKYGQPGMVQTGAGATPVVSSPQFGVKQTGPTIGSQFSPQQLAAPHEWIDKNGQKQTGTFGQFLSQQGINLPTPPAQVAPAAPQGSQPSAEPAYAPALPNPPMPRPKPAMAQAPGVMDQSTFLGKPIEGPSPMFAPGQAQFAEELKSTGQKLVALRPLVQALPLLDGLRTGPTTKTFTDVVAALKANNIIPTDAINDPTAIRQIVNKKLADYLSSSPVGQRSDAAQLLKQSASPDPGGQINQALVKLAKDAVALDKSQAAAALAFQHSGEKDFSKFPAFNASFPLKVDIKAFGVDHMSPNEKSALKDWLGKATEEQRQKFAASWKLGKELGLINPNATLSESEPAPTAVPTVTSPAVKPSFALPVR